MGWWKLEACKQDSEGDLVELDDADLEHIAEAIKEGYTQGGVVDSDEEEEQIMSDKDKVNLSREELCWRYMAHANMPAAVSCLTGKKDKQWDYLVEQRPFIIVNEN